jgi:hypothetical protein
MYSRHALLLGSFEYAKEPRLKQLQGPPNDIVDLARVLGDAEIGGFHCEYLINEASSLTFERLEEFLLARTRKETTLVYFSGHGVKDVDGELYFAMANTHLDRLRSTALKAREVNELLMRCKAQQKLLILDCCYSGAFARGMLHRGGERVNPQEFIDGRGLAVLTASDAIQYAFEVHDPVMAIGVSRSVLTSALVAGLESGEADENGDGLITFDEWYDHAYLQVSKHSVQTPRKWAMDQQGRLIVARVPTRNLKPKALPDEVLQLIHHPHAEVRVIGVKALEKLARGPHAGMALSARRELQRIAEKDDSRMVSEAARYALLGVPADTTCSPPAATAEVPSLRPATSSTTCMETSLSGRRIAGISSMSRLLRMEVPGARLLQEIARVVFSAGVPGTPSLRACAPRPGVRA